MPAPLSVGQEYLYQTTGAHLTFIFDENEEAWQDSAQYLTLYWNSDIGIV